MDLKINFSFKRLRNSTADSAEHNSRISRLEKDAKVMSV